MAKLQERSEQLAFALEKGVITQEEYNAALAEAHRRWNPAVRAAEEAARQQAAEQMRLADEYRRQVDRFQQMGKTPVESFKELMVDLEQVRAALTPSQFEDAKNKLLSDLAGGLGIATYLQDVAAPAQKLAETYKNLENYAREAGLTAKELTAAKDRARAALKKQSEFYNLYQRAQNAMLTTQERLNRELGRIADEAKKWGYLCTFCDFAEIFLAIAALFAFVYNDANPSFRRHPNANPHSPHRSLPVAHVHRRKGKRRVFLPRAT